ncbi:MAG: hypothetical protein KKB21_00105 [Nanoarchaeota archaeon]|nr:hypothetical protein [Nanoarchaeota archaeon]MBU4085961.1 hypothetical protein [Nanoarchaeota archaeon]
MRLPEPLDSEISTATIVYGLARGDIQQGKNPLEGMFIGSYLQGFFGDIRNCSEVREYLSRDFYGERRGNLEDCFNRMEYMQDHGAELHRDPEFQEEMRRLSLRARIALGIIEGELNEQGITEDNPQRKILKQVEELLKKD